MSAFCLAAFRRAICRRPWSLGARPGGPPEQVEGARDADHGGAQVVHHQVRDLVPGPLEPGVLESEADRLREGLGEAHLLGPERPRVGALDVQDPERPSVAPQRHRQLAAGVAEKAT